MGQICITSLFSLEISKWLNTELDTGATVNTFLVKIDREGVGDGSSYYWITDVEARQS